MIIIPAHPIHTYAYAVVADDPMRISIKVGRSGGISARLILRSIRIDKAIPVDEINGFIDAIGRCQRGKTADTRAAPGMTARRISLEQTIIVIAFMPIVHRRLEPSRAIGVIKKR